MGTHRIYVEPFIINASSVDDAYDLAWERIRDLDVEIEEIEEIADTDSEYLLDEVYLEDIEEDN